MVRAPFKLFQTSQISVELGAGSINMPLRLGTQTYEADDAMPCTRKLVDVKVAGELHHLCR